YLPHVFFFCFPPPPPPPLFPYTTLFRSPFRILCGIEVDILDDGSLDQDDDLLARLGIVVASVHSRLKDDSATMTRRMTTAVANRSEEHTSELQSRENLVCRLLLEKKKPN